jgi:hypothetical protein
MPTEHDLAEKLRKLEALFARPGTEGERAAAGSALERIRARLRLIERTEAPREYRFALPDQWARALFLALARRYELSPYRRHGQRATTVMLRACPSFVDGTLWPEFQQLHAVLHRYLDEVTRQMIQRAVHPDASEADEREGSHPAADQGRPEPPGARAAPA